MQCSALVGHTFIFKKIEGEITMSKIFDVDVNFEGTYTYPIKADSEDEAKEKAENIFADESDANIGSCVTDYEVGKCVERIFTEVTEVCPHCDKEITLLWDVQKDGYKAFCPKCGGVLMLCSMCLEDNNKCDWCNDSESCFRTRGW